MAAGAPTRAKTDEVTLRASQAICRRAFDFLASHAGATGGSIHVLEGRMLVPLATFPKPLDGELKIRVPLGEGVVGKVLASEASHYVPDVSHNGGGQDGVNSYLMVPLLNEGRPVGVLQIDSAELDGFRDEAQKVVLSYVPMLAAALDQSRRVDEVRAENLDRKNVLSAVAHELRTPLAAVIGFAETLNQGAAAFNPEMLATASHHLVKASRRLDRLIGDLLDASRLDRGALTIRASVVPVLPVIEQALFEVDMSEHDLQVALPDSLPAVTADSDRLHQVLVNLLSNARKYSYPGTTVRLSAEVQSSKLSISVSDEGLGIPPSEIGRVFEPFHRVEDPARTNVTGLGLGLYLVREICLAMDCEVSVQSELEAGSTFTIQVPLARA
jgi:signal transduction histidine kinase